LKPNQMAIGALLIAVGLEFLLWGWIQASNPLNCQYGLSEGACQIEISIWLVGMVLSPIGAAILAHGIGSKTES